MRCTLIFRERVATFKFEKSGFLSELQQGWKSQRSFKETIAFSNEI
jgi:hypothetical protein